MDYQKGDRVFLNKSDNDIEIVNPYIIVDITSERYLLRSMTNSPGKMHQREESSSNFSPIVLSEKGQNIGIGMYWNNDKISDPTDKSKTIEFNRNKYSKELEWLNSDFKSSSDNKYTGSYLLSQYENAGATYGIELVIDILNASFILRTYEDSGYSTGYIIKVGSIEDINRITRGFEPTINK